MRRKIKLILLLLLFCMAFCLTADFVFTQYFTGTSPVATSNKIYRLTEEDHLQEIPVFGSSRAEKAYYCDSINSNCYNYGFPNQSYDVTALLLKFELSKNKTTPLIIDVHHDFFEHNAITNININTYLPFANNNTAIRSFLEKNERLLPYQYIPGMRYFGAYTAYLQPIVENKFHVGNNDYIKGGVFDSKPGNNRSIQKRIDNRSATR